MILIYDIIRYECADNPCQDGYWPFEDETGVMKCFPGDETLEGCRDDLIFKNGTQVQYIYCLTNQTEVYSLCQV